jgi:hypothetical protein
MEAQGISVTEIRLGLPNTYYYLCWRPWQPPERPAARRAMLGQVRDVCRNLGWKVYAARVGVDTACLVFQTTADNLEHGIARLLRGSGAHQLYMVDPVDALPFIARIVHESKDADRPCAPWDASGHTEDWPDVHFGLFMGGYQWAARMLELLTRCATDEDPGTPCPATLSELARAHASRHDAIAEAYRSGRFSLKDIADHFEMHFSEISAIVNTASRPEPRHPDRHP